MKPEKEGTFIARYYVDELGQTSEVDVTPIEVYTIGLLLVMLFIFLLAFAIGFICGTIL